MENLEMTKLFHSITDKETERILKCSRSCMKKYPTGTYIFEQGGLPTRLFLLLSGQVQICKDFTSGKRDVLYLVEKCPGISFIISAPMPATIISS